MVLIIPPKEESVLIIEFLNNYWKFMKSVNSHSEIGWKLINGNEISRENNFDLIRLFAALQVLLGHGINHLQILGYDEILDVISFFPGVMVFFVISGFLITRSYINCSIKKSIGGGKYILQYIKNRCLRIFPALWFAFILAMALLLLFKVISFTSFLNLDLWAWFFGQITIFQYYTPNLLRNFGVGTPNGSLWTIPVELEFYILLPVFFLFLKHISIKVKFIALFLFSAMFNFLWTSACESGESILDKLIEVSIFPYLYAFLFGGLMFLNWSKIKWFIEGKICYWFLIYGLYCYFADALPGYHLDDWTTLLANLLLGILTISAAFSKISLGKVLHGNDISYGIYIYHMLVINVFVQMKFVGNISYLLMALIITVCIAIISWVFIEKKALSLKYKL